MAAEGRVTVETLGESGRWYKRSFPLTPATAIVAETDWKDEGHRTVWYNCANYRVNLFAEGGRFWIRDLYRFDERYRERYFDRVCKTDYLEFDNLPVMDGNRFSGAGVRAGLYPYYRGRELTMSAMDYREDGERALVTFQTDDCGAVVFALSPSGIDITAEKNAGDFSLRARVNPAASGFPAVHAGERALSLRHNGFDYRVTLASGVFVSDGMTMLPENGRIAVRFDE